MYVLQRRGVPITLVTTNPNSIVLRNFHVRAYDGLVKIGSTVCRPRVSSFPGHHRRPLDSICRQKIPSGSFKESFVSYYNILFVFRQWHRRCLPGFRQPQDYKINKKESLTTPVGLKKLTHMIVNCPREHESRMKRGNPRRFLFRP